MHVTYTHLRPAALLLEALLPAALLLALACGSESEDSPPILTSSEGPAPFDPGRAYQPLVSAGELATEIDNPLFRAPVGARWVYEGRTDEGLERIEVTVLPELRSIWGTQARVVRDTVYVAGEMVEDTLDFYAQDGTGNVWYLGEESFTYEDGVKTSSEGSWESGVDGALPGVVMLAAPEVGDAYRQEYYDGEAEDFANVLALEESVSVPAGQFSGCLKTRDLSAIDTDADENKYYCPGVGNVLEEEEDTRIELMEYTGL